ncbi:DUF4235 domain-containing protein [Nonomuraea mesophila]|uniref:DUF4235 domain-containing protein n=1 Tax=Nonomuraea mesophila TaxID=2530382 RepID=A0A4R5FU20_9ACTN|nr:DUF4235 domain-containing protein [Nonomuraea mesophila]TDE57424.1 DUF4235 domain-containing protein [Nonomuraea mesophila]
MHPVQKAASLGMGLLSGALATLLFRRMWKLAAGEDDSPDAEDLDRDLTEILVAAAVQGALFGLIKAIVHRASAKTFRRRAIRSGHSA